ncbi:HAD domain-containing protein [Glycomyces xiaoerkulensis]|uniref:hypothetical protein n=1 Tax=Glycomyces xiaoerkulensis TaxID=2038139 RepID=UPI0012FFE9CA|nr:hypothetical protein [Glycomyces xiaoerkulensis]
MRSNAVGGIGSFEEMLGASDRPCWLLDVDGVLNAGQPCWSNAQQRLVSSRAAGVLRLTWSPPLLDRIRAVAESGLVDLVWATTWCPEGEILEDLWNLPTLTRAWTAELYGPAAAEAKAAAATEVTLAGRPLIWTDDELAEDLAEPDRLEIRPRSRCGLAPGDLEAIERFVARHARSGGGRAG